MLFLLQYIASAVFSSVRVYALGNRSGILFTVVSVLGAVPFVSNLVNFTKESLIFKLHDIPEGTSFCISILGLSGSKELRGVSAANRGSLILADLVVLAVTLRKTLGTLRTASRLHMRVPLVATLVKDGSMFFLMLLTINVVVALNDNIQPDTALRNLSSSLLQALPPILLSRFMLSLRQANANTTESRTGSGTQRSTIRFNSDVLIGNMGESLEFGADSDLQDGGQDESDAHSESSRLETEHDISTHGIGSSQEGIREQRADDIV
ncbi:hypothetical protein BC629DRAFT_1189999 [Irpex lacteus]|nr:hypothetical protein BC629DRAFT_1189999 [Irpex lacteus]